MSEPKQQELSLEALRSGDRAEFARLVDAHSTKIYRLALKMLANPQDAEDVLQNTFIKAMQALLSFEVRSSLSTWLYRIAVNEALMILRRQKPEVNVAEYSADGDLDDYTPTIFVDWCCLPEGELMSSEAKKHLDKAIQKLPEKLRIVFILRDIEELSIRETSQMLELTDSAVKTRLLRARLQLREQLSIYYGAELNEEKSA